ncbi:hypothetical protein Q0S72_25105, partial [Escherichia coli O4:H2]
RETPLRECAGIIKNDTHRVLPRERDADCTHTVASPVRWWKKPDNNTIDNHSHFGGSSWWGGPSTGRVGAEKGAFL